MVVLSPKSSKTSSKRLSTLEIALRTGFTQAFLMHKIDAALRWVDKKGAAAWPELRDAADDLARALRAEFPGLKRLEEKRLRRLLLGPEPKEDAVTSQNLPDLPDVELLSEAQREPEPKQADAELEPEPSDVEVKVGTAVLDLRGSTAPEEELDLAIKSDIERVDAKTRLHLQFNGCTGLRNCAALARSLVRKTYVEELNISFRDCCSLDSITDFAKAVPHLTNLRALYLDFYGCETLEWIYVLGKTMPMFPPLTSLHIDLRCCSSLLSITDTCAGIASLRQLKDLNLDLELCALNFAGFPNVVELEESLRKLKRLESLRLRFGGWRMLARIDELGKSLASLKKLVALTLDFHGCSRLQSVAEVGASVRNLEHLETLRMGFKYCMELESVAPLAEGVSWLKELSDFAVDLSCVESLPRVVQYEFDSREEFVVAAGVCSAEELEERIYVPPPPEEEQGMYDVIPGEEWTCWLRRTETRKAEGCGPKRVCQDCFVYRYWCRFCHNPKCRVFFNEYSGYEEDMRCAKRQSLDWGIVADDQPDQLNETMQSKSSIISM